MKSKFRNCIAVAVIALSLVSCGKSDPEKPDGKPDRDLAGYKTLYQETFRNYQNATTQIPKKGTFDFESTANVDGDEKKLESFAGKAFGEAFSLFSVKWYGDYDFEDVDRATLLADIKAYLNKVNTGQGNLEMSVGIASGSLTYEVRNLDPKLLKFFQIDPEISKTLVDLVEENRWKRQELALGTNLVKEVISSFKESSEEGPLYKNSKEEEKKIIDAFLASDTVEVLSGSWKDTATERISFRFNPENFSKFLNETAKILGNGNENKDFSSDAKTLGDTVRIEGTMDIRDNRIVDSDMKFVFRIGGIDEKSGEKKMDDLVAKVRFALPNPAKLDFDLDTQIYANSSPDNVLRLRFKWLIK